MTILEVSGVLRSHWYIDVAWFFKKRLDILYRMCNVKLEKHSITLDLQRHAGTNDYVVVAWFFMHVDESTDWHELERMCKTFGIYYWRPPYKHSIFCEVRWTPEEFGIDEETCNDIYFQTNDCMKSVKSIISKIQKFNNYDRSRY